MTIAWAKGVDLELEELEAGGQLLLAWRNSFTMARTSSEVTAALVEADGVIVVSAKDGGDWSASKMEAISY